MKWYLVRMRHVTLKLFSNRHIYYILYQSYKLYKISAQQRVQRRFKTLPIISRRRRRIVRDNRDAGQVNNYLRPKFLMMNKQQKLSVITSQLLLNYMRVIRLMIAIKF